ncbi:MAG: symmetrical bis(5'-nucleosyl)-tetraphosphatase [Thermoanaerobaculia bacterium]
MATFAIGDVHGCYHELDRLLTVMPINWKKDRLWLVGDLVNQGPESLEVLRWARKLAKKMDDRFRMVLGNHDLRLLAMAAGWAKARSRDTAREILEARDGDKLVEWLASQPLLHRENGYLLVHAGLWPHWTPKAAEKWARRVEEALRRGKGKAKQLLSPSVELDDMGDSTAELAYALQAFTELRTCTHKGKPCTFKGPPVVAPKGCMPWFAVPGRRSAKVTVVCGHWAALGLRVERGLFALDTGCVWGGALTAVRLEDSHVYSQRAL